MDTILPHRIWQKQASKSDVNYVFILPLDTLRGRPAKFYSSTNGGSNLVCEHIFVAGDLTVH